MVGNLIKMLIRARETLPLDTSTGPVKLELIGATLNFRTEIEHCTARSATRENFDVDTPQIEICRHPPLGKCMFEVPRGRHACISG